VTEFFANLNLLIIFLLIGGVGFLFLLVSLVVGDLFEAAGFDLDFDGGDGGFGILDSRVLSVFITAFGGFGAIGVQMGWGALGSSLAGLAGGIIFGAAVSLFGRFLYSQQATSSFSTNALVGRTAQVTVAIQAGQIGQITCRVGEERVEKIARTRDGAEIPLGTIVKIEESSANRCREVKS
jgi:hypothetical protein